MDNKTLSLISQDFAVAIHALRVIHLTKDVIAELEKRNRARKLSVYNKIDSINYDVDEVENLVEAYRGHANYKQTIVKQIIDRSLNKIIK